MAPCPSCPTARPLRRLQGHVNLLHVPDGLRNVSSDGTRRFRASCKDRQPPHRIDVRCGDFLHCDPNHDSGEGVRNVEHVSWHPRRPALLWTLCPTLVDRRNEITRYLENAWRRAGGEPLSEEGWGSAAELKAWEHKVKKALRML